MVRPRNRSNRPTQQLCDWCTIDITVFPSQPELNTNAEFRLTATDMNGVLLSSIHLCAACAKRGAAFDGYDFDPKD